MSTTCGCISTLEVAARLTNRASIGVSGRVRRNQMAQVWGRSMTVRLAVKPRNDNLDTMNKRGRPGVVRSQKSVLLSWDYG